MDQTARKEVVFGGMACLLRNFISSVGGSFLADTGLEN